MTIKAANSVDLPFVKWNWRSPWSNLILARIMYLELLLCLYMDQCDLGLHHFWELEQYMDIPDVEFLGIFPFWIMISAISWKYDFGGHT